MQKQIPAVTIVSPFAIESKHRSTEELQLRTSPEGTAYSMHIWEDIKTM
jgi:hypothetical protein